MVVGLFAAVATCAIAAVAGVGGGGILVPLFAVTLNMPLAKAVALSQATITGQSLLTVCAKVRLPHPSNDKRPLINWTLMTFWLPCSLAGTSIGNLIGKTVPDWFRIVLLLLLFSYTLVRVVQKTIQQRTTDRERQLVINQENETPPVVTEQLAEPEVKHTLSCGALFPAFSMVVIASTFLPLGVINYVQSSRAGLVKCGSDTFWAVFSGSTVYNISVTVLVRVHLRRVFLALVHDNDAASDEASARLPFKWNRSTSLWYPIVAISAGGAASLLGIGGGLILSALFLEAGLTPEEVSATSGITTLLVAAESFGQYALQGTVDVDFGIAAAGAGLVGSVIGMVLQREIKRRRASFMIVGCLALIMGGSMVALTADGAYSTWRAWRDHESLGFNGVCHKRI
eukprot:CAMPEP_0174850994 /NCGR_PEP_ID=MMETSP1114-20130205/21248_1 /TAXON_ID=312471 /ORGANISM="Neobodo designis, Strain CCAP 1951/1" /LENGTH=398 /DNA_ID=CAMNT_0016085491 /DNA_START=248 /DNA_END=1444 /DNA_ORIENTATION=+